MRFKNGCFLAVMVCVSGALRATSAQEFPDENRKQLVDVIGGPFLVFRDKAMEELQITDEQKQKLFMRFAEQVQQTGPFLDSLQDAQPGEREKKINEHRKQAHEKLASLLKETLQPEQLKRLRQITIRQEGLFGLAEADIAAIVKELQITPEQQKNIVAIGEEVPRLVQKAVATEGPEQAPKLLKKIRRDQNRRIETVLTDEQKKKWQEVLGMPFELDD